jgi:hypothetical protein
MCDKIKMKEEEGWKKKLYYKGRQRETKRKKRKKPNITIKILDNNYITKSN